MSKELSGLEATKLMRALDQETRLEAIATSKNVIGHDRFTQVSRQVELREAYRKPKPSDDGPKVG